MIARAFSRSSFRHRNLINTLTGDGRAVRSGSFDISQRIQGLKLESIDLMRAAAALIQYN